VRFIGLMASGLVQFSDDCTVDPSFPPGPDDHCQVVDPAVLTSFDYLDVARMVIRPTPAIRCSAIGRRRSP
jgi:hypothetical protein